jgi:FkbM family methyltransferase
MNERSLDNAMKVIQLFTAKLSRARDKFVPKSKNFADDPGNNPWEEVVAGLRRVTGRDYTKADAFEINRAHVGAMTIESLIHDFIGKGYNSSLEEEVDAHAKLVSNPEIIFDVGANRGSWSTAALHRFPHARIFAFEPSSDHAPALDALKNRFGERFTVINQGVSNSAGRAVLYKDTEGSGLASLHDRELERYDLKLDKKESVKLTTLDSVCEAYGINQVDIIKIDVEGHEMKVLEGAIDILKKVTIVQFEFGGAMLDSHYYFKDFYEFFTKRGFEIYRICRYGFCPVAKYYEQHESFDGANYFAYRREPRHDTA